MHTFNFVRLFSVLGFAGSLLVGVAARADVAPPPDGGSVVDMAAARDLSTVAKPDMTLPNDDTGTKDGCAFVAPGKGTHGSSLVLVAAGMAAFLVSRRKKNA